MTSPPISAVRGSRVIMCPSIARTPRTTAPRPWRTNPMTVGRPILQESVTRACLRTLIFGSVRLTGVTSPFLSHAYSASYFAGVILTYITIITI